MEELPNGLPPILPDISQSVEALLTDLESLPIHDLQKAQRWWPRKPNPESLFHMPSLAVDMTLQVERHLTTGELIDFKEVSDDQENSNVINLADLLSGQDDIDFLDEEQDEDVTREDQENEVKEDDDTNLEEIPSLVCKTNELMNLRFINIRDTIEGVTSERKEKWAVEINVSVPVKDFHKKIPSMAYQWPFELDTFQKQAILRLEDHDSVFVAAHTSAGKTVVAEYAIALALRNMTRVVYTSPIKALSNQKFRDFKTTFENVGLLTGDVQINPDAACLIMTTEILRSILYNGADLVRDLEWVIFDEVHYINDASRGVVWEEVLILLPDHVSVILLSATVPNTMQFAEWVGRIKKKKIYVISTLKRPVPLEHYLYTGNSTKTSKELFMIIDSQKNFITKGYNLAMDAKKQRETKASGYGAKGFRDGNTKTKCLSLVVHMLEEERSAACVCFTFSKKRCDDNAYSLLSLDLTTSEEKNKVHIFFKKCVARLKGTDKQLPQILFATETFAMGVNMPARTVVYDSIRKHDGTSLRHLNPGSTFRWQGEQAEGGSIPQGQSLLLCKGTSRRCQTFTR
ncbi:putative helicase SKI2W-like [Apostichopus japonicus]|uniref:Putative helicase SKI2W-like n=1 Tax=Stichopus japonicus TaxID=307972 RepID=A0A2G8LKQ3_STIJA|nr:putative helicase SKI2W-like [Apostichopus japonicus]